MNDTPKVSIVLIVLCASYFSLGSAGALWHGVPVGLETPEVVGALDAIGLLNLGDLGPWPGEPEGENAWGVD